MKRVRWRKPARGREELCDGGDFNFLPSLNLRSLQLFPLRVGFQFEKTKKKKGKASGFLLTLFYCLFLSLWNFGFFCMSFVSYLLTSRWVDF